MDRLMKAFQNTETLPVLVMNYFWSREQKWYRVGKEFVLTSRWTESSILLTLRNIGACLHQSLNLRNENLLSTFRSVDAYDQQKRT